MRLGRLVFTLLRPLWAAFDACMPKREDHWAFATHPLHTGRFIENQRAMFEHVKSDAAIRKIIFYRGECDDLEIEHGANYELVEHGSLRGMWLLARCKVVFLANSVAMDYSLRWGGRQFSIVPLAMRRRVVVNLWHGIPLKRLFYAANEQTRIKTGRVAYRNRERLGYKGLVASSDIDSYAMAAMFYPLNYLQVWRTGLPRNDFLVGEEQRLPRYIRNSLHKIRQVRRGRRLVVYAPTYRQTGIEGSAGYYQFSDSELERLKALMRKHDAVFGFRPHYFKNSQMGFNLDSYVDGELIVDLSLAAVPEFSAVARECDLLVTDYSSVYMETLYLKKPAVCFAYDLESYKQQQDGLLYDLSLAFPGPVCESFDGMLEAVDRQMASMQSDTGDGLDNARKTAHQIFFSYGDDRNSERVYERVRNELESLGK